MQLFQEYIVGRVSHDPHLFSVRGSDVKYLEQFETKYWIDALWQRYNFFLAQALRKRQEDRNKAGYREFVNIKYHEIFDNIKGYGFARDRAQRMALIEAINQAEARYFHIQPRNRTLEMSVSVLSFKEGSEIDRVRELGIFKANDYIFDLIRELEKTPKTANGYDLTGLREHENVDINTKSLYSTRGFQFPSRNTIRKALRRWIEFTGYDFLHGSETLIPTAAEKEDYQGFKETEINKLYTKYLHYVYQRFFETLIPLERPDYASFVRSYGDVLNHIRTIITEHNIETLARSDRRFLDSGPVEFIRRRILSLVRSSASDAKIINEFKTYLSDRTRTRYLCELLANIDLRVARVNGTYVDFHGRLPRFDRETITDELMDPRIKMKTIKINKFDPATEDYVEVETKVPELVSGKVLYPIHDRPDLQQNPNARGETYHFDDLHLDPSTKRKKVKLFMQVNDPDDYERSKLKKDLVILGGGIEPNAQNSPRRHGFTSSDAGYSDKVRKVRELLVINRFVIDTIDNIITPTIAPSTAPDSVELSTIVVEFLKKKFTEIQNDRAAAIPIKIHWRYWGKCLDFEHYKYLHDHCVELLVTNDLTSLSSVEIRNILNRLFDRMMQLDFGCGTRKQRKRGCGNNESDYNCNLIKRIIRTFYEEDYCVEDEDGSCARQHDLYLRADNRQAIEEFNRNRRSLQMYRNLVAAYARKYEGKFPEAEVRNNSELCASAYIEGGKARGVSLPDYIQAEIDRLSSSDAEPNCEIVNDRSEFEKAYKIIRTARSKPLAVFNSEEVSFLQKFREESSKFYVKTIADILNSAELNTVILDRLITSIKRFSPVGMRNKEEVESNIEALRNLKAFIITDSNKQFILDELVKPAKSNKLAKLDPNIKQLFINIKTCFSS